MRALSFIALSLLACGPAPAATTSNRECSGCHPTQFTAFGGSSHNHAARSDLFRALRATAPAPDQAFCDSCHAGHAVEGEVGVGCVTCHRATGNRGVMNARLVTDPAGPMLGPITDPMGTTAHTSRASDFTRSSDLCGTCHEVSGPGGFVETPYTEWSRSPAMRAAIQCADCHMSPSPGDPSALRPTGAAALNGPLRRLSDHAFVGPDDPRAPELLAQSASLTLSVAARGATGIEVAVRVLNRNSAHALPSGARFAREVWIELTYTDPTGAIRVLSGEDSDAPDPMRVDLGDRVLRDGVAALPTRSDAPEVRAIPAGESREHRYLVPLGSVSAGARLRYRRNDRALRRALGLPDDPRPVIDLATASLML